LPAESGPAEKQPGAGSGSVLDTGFGAVVGTVFRTESRREGTTLTEFTRQLVLRKLLLRKLVLRKQGLRKMDWRGLVAALIAVARRDRNALASLGAATGKNRLSALRFHPRPKTVRLGPAAPVGLKCALRHGNPVLLRSYECREANVEYMRGRGLGANKTRHGGNSFLYCRLPADSGYSSVEGCRILCAIAPGVR
jgi:hypothetical protein